MLCTFNNSLFFWFSENLSIISLSLTTFIAFSCLAKIYETIHKCQNIPLRASIPMGENNSTNVMKILDGTDKSAMKKLITAEGEENRSLKHALLIFNMAGSGPPDFLTRRRINKFFMECLTDVELSHAAALVWLKKHLYPETCDIILSDLKYTGEWK